MHPRKTPILACAAAVLALCPLGERLEFHPADGSQSSKIFRVEGDFELGDISFVVDGTDMAAALPADLSGDFAVSLSIVDHYLKTVDGRLIELKRECAASSGEYSAAEESGAKDDVFGLDGETVVYKWNAETKQYDRSFQDGEGDSDKLEGLGVDLDYRALLPEREVAAGDKWAVEPKALMSALFFGADFEQLAQGAGDDPEFAKVADRILPEIEKLFEAFKAECEYVGTREEDGVRLAEIAIEIDSRGDADLASVLLELMKEQADGEEVSFDLDRALLSVSLRGEGKLLWNLAASHAHSFELATEVEIVFEMSLNVTAPDGQDHSAEVDAEVLGNSKWTMEPGK